jgi:hypothetical protein
VVANDLQRTVRHPDLSLKDREALLSQFLSDVSIRDRTEQTAVNASLLCQLDHGTAEFGALGLALSQFSGGDFLKISTLDFELLDRDSGSAASATRWNQEIACVAVFNFDDITQIAEVDYFVEQNNLHSCAPYRLRCWSL